LAVEYPSASELEYQWELESLSGLAYPLELASAYQSGSQSPSVLLSACLVGVAVAVGVGVAVGVEVGVELVSALQLELRSWSRLGLVWELALELALRSRLELERE